MNDEQNDYTTPSKSQKQRMDIYTRTRSPAQSPTETVALTVGNVAADVLGDLKGGFDAGVEKFAVSDLGKDVHAILSSAYDRAKSAIDSNRKGGVDAIAAKLKSGDKMRRTPNHDLYVKALQKIADDYAASESGQFETPVVE